MNIAVIFAGGTGKRMGCIDKPKQFYSVMGKPIIVHTVEQFQNCAQVDAIVVSCLIHWVDYMWNLVKEYDLNKVVKIVPGGETGQESIYHGLLAAKDLAGEDDAIVLVHDGVRPMISSSIIEENISCVHQYGAAITCARMTETPVVTDESSVETVIPRDKMRIAKAPQSFWLNQLLEAHEKAIASGRNDFIDSCELMSHFGVPCYVVECDTTNIKVTTVEDLQLLWALLQAQDLISNFY